MKVECTSCGTELKPHCPSSTCTWMTCTAKTCDHNTYDLDRGTLIFRNGTVHRLGA